MNPSEKLHEKTEYHQVLQSAPSQKTLTDQLFADGILTDTELSFITLKQKELDERKEWEARAKELAGENAKTLSTVSVIPTLKGLHFEFKDADDKRYLVQFDHTAQQAQVTGPGDYRSVVPYTKFLSAAAAKSDTALYSIDTGNALHKLVVGEDSKPRLSAVAGAKKENGLPILPSIEVLYGRNGLESFIKSFNASFNHKAVFTATGTDASRIEQAYKPERGDNLKEFFKTLQVNPDLHLMSDGVKKKFDETKVPWQHLESFGLTKADLQKRGDYEKLLVGERTSLIHLKGVFNDVPVHMSGKLMLSEAGGKISFSLKGRLDEQALATEVGKASFSEAQKKELLERGQLTGPVVAVAEGKEKRFYVGIDREINQIVKVSEEKLMAQNNITIGGIVLNKAQVQNLLSGRSVQLDGLKDAKGQAYGATLQGSINFSNNTLTVKEIPPQKLNKTVQAQNEVQQRHNQGGEKREAAKKAPTLNEKALKPKMRP